MHQVIAFLSFLLLFMQTHQTDQIYSVPFTPLEDPWINPSEGVLVSEDIPVYFARKINGEVEFQKYNNVVKSAIDYALVSPEYQRAKVNGSIKSPERINTQSENPHAPAVLYPELLVVVAHDLYKKLNSDVWKTIPYLVAFYNGVDIIYRELQNPKIRFNIATIIIEHEYGVFEYLKNTSTNDDKVKVSTVHDAGLFWYQQKDEFPLDSYDAVISMTSRAFCRGTSSSGQCSQLALGLALPSAMCEYSHADKQIFKVASITDYGDFGSILATAHELGHLFGAYHDYSRKESEKTGFADIPRCNSTYNDDYIMHLVPVLSTTGRYWSGCSLDYFQRYLTEKNHTCLHNVPRQSKHPISRFIPGRIIGSFDDLRRVHGIGKECSELPGDTCQSLSEQLDNKCLYRTNIILDGLYCDDDDPTKMCMVGKCVGVFK